MIQVRCNLFETNSSSACTFSIYLFREDSITIPKEVHIELNGRNRIDNKYYWAVRDGKEEAFLAFLKSIGVSRIYVDGQLVDPDIEKASDFKDDRELTVATCFAEVFEHHSEWESWGDEMEDGPDGISYVDGYKIQQKVKDPAYTVIVLDGRTGEEMPWNECPLSQTVFDPRFIAELESRAEENARREKEWEEYKTKFREKWGIDLDEFEEVYKESSEQIEDDYVNKDEAYYDALQEKMTQEMIKRRKRG